MNTGFIQQKLTGIIRWLFLRKPRHVSILHWLLNLQKLIWLQVQNVGVSSRNTACYCSYLVTVPWCIFCILHIQAVSLGHRQAQPLVFCTPLIILWKTRCI